MDRVPSQIVPKKYHFCSLSSRATISLLLYLPIGLQVETNSRHRLHLHLPAHLPPRRQIPLLRSFRPIRSRRVTTGERTHRARFIPLLTVNQSRKGEKSLLDVMSSNRTSSNKINPSLPAPFLNLPHIHLHLQIALRPQKHVLSVGHPLDRHVVPHSFDTLPTAGIAHVEN